jgi:hypothetical protein
MKNARLKEFFQRQILDLDEDDVSFFLRNYSSDDVFLCLSEELDSISLSDSEWAWKLGRVFGSMSHQYCADIYIYSLFDVSDNTQRKIHLNFLCGYWDNAQANLETVISMARRISFDNSSDFDDSIVSLLLEAITTAYLNNQNSFEYNEKAEVKKMLISFKKRISVFAPKSPTHQLLLQIE